MNKSVLIIVFSVFVLSLSVLPVSAVDKTLPSGRMMAIATDHEQFIRQAFDLAISAGKKGNHPFGAVLVHQGKAILTAENTVNTDNDFSHHAEANLLARANREFSREVLRQSTIYTSDGLGSPAIK